MNIKYTNTSCNFADLCVGDAFAIYADGERYTCIKIERIDADD